MNNRTASDHLPYLDLCTAVGEDAHEIAVRNYCRILRLGSTGKHGEAVNVETPVQSDLNQLIGSRSLQKSTVSSQSSLSTRTAVPRKACAKLRLKPISRFPLRHYRLFPTKNIGNANFSQS